jgi:putative DNA primase/helicase
MAEIASAGVASTANETFWHASEFKKSASRSQLACWRETGRRCTGELRPHEPELLLTKVTMVDFVPGATHPDWDQALAALTADAAEWIQVRLGQGITGHAVPDDRAAVLKGSGENGKTTLVNAVQSALGGDYAVTLSERVLLARNGDHPTELMDLRGARLALVEEFPELGHLKVKRLKDLHGTARMKARHCRKDTVEWEATHTLFVTTNYLPRVDESDHGTWRRLALVDFPYRYRKRHERLEWENDRVGDPGLRERLSNGGNGRHEAILAWLVVGAMHWYANSRVMPTDRECIRKSTEAWRKSADLLLRFVTDVVEFDRRSHVVSTELFANFTDRLKANGHHEWTDQNFTARLSQHSEVPRWVKKKRVLQGEAGLSRRLPQGRGSVMLPKQYWAWSGIRFRADDEKSENSE